MAFRAKVIRYLLLDYLLAYMRRRLPLAFTGRYLRGNHLKSQLGGLESLKESTWRLPSLQEHAVA